MPNDEDDWSSAYETMNSLSGLWGGGELGNRAFATLSGLSAGWQSTANTFSGASGGWDSAYTTAKSNSATLFTVSGNWNTAYSDRHKWDGGATDLVVATGRTSLGLGTIATQDADSVDIDGGTDIGADLADADLIIVDDGAGGTNRKATLSRLKTYIGAGAADDLSAGDAAVTLTTTSGNITIDAAANNSDIIF